jgi:hypothetical protein
MTSEEENLNGSDWPKGTMAKDQDTPAVRFLKHVQECEVCGQTVTAFCAKAQRLLKEALEVKQKAENSEGEQDVRQE